MCTGDMEELTSNHSYDAFYVGENSWTNISSWWGRA